MIRLNNVSKQFDTRLVINNIDLSISRGEIVGLLGPNGAGKTTTLRMVAGVLPPSRGTITIDGKDLKNHGQEAKARIGYLPENNPLYDELTTEEHLLFWAKVKGLQGTQVTNTIRAVVHDTGIADVFYRPISELSKGFRQRVGLSQSILTRPDILILDEPTEGLDPNQRRDMQELIQMLGKERTVIISSHVLSEISKICNRIVIIHKGAIVADDSPEKLTQRRDKTQVIEAEIEGQHVSDKLKTIKGVRAVTKTAANYYTVEADKGKDLRGEISAMSLKNKWTILTLKKKEIALEDVFSSLTSE